MTESQIYIQLMSLLSTSKVFKTNSIYMLLIAVSLVHTCFMQHVCTIQCAYFGSAVFQTEGENFWEKSSRTF